MLGVTLEPPRPHQFYGKLPWQDLDGHLSAEIPIEGTMNLAHPALAKFF
jgi:hypothetical protein